MTHHPDSVLVRVIQGSPSLREAGNRLGLTKRQARTQADRLGVRSTFRYGVERLPPDQTLAAMLRTTRSIQVLAKRFNVTRALLMAKAEELGVDGRQKIRAGLPWDPDLYRELLYCERFADVAARYGVPEHTIRNQAKRLGVPSPTRRGQAKGASHAKV